MVARLPKFKVSTGYAFSASTDTLMFGKSDVKIMPFKDLDFLLKVLSPLNSAEWLDHLRFLKRNESYTIRIQDNVQGKILNKFLKIQRN